MQEQIQQAGREAMKEALVQAIGKMEEQLNGKLDCYRCSC
jgi:hypothetical protein